MNLQFSQGDMVSLAEKHNLEFVALFGSQARGSTHDKSDIDIAVISHTKLDIPGIMSEMSEIFKKEDVQVIDLSQASPTLMYAVVKDGKALYEEKDASFFRWKLYAIKIWMETSWLRNMRTKKIREWSVKTV